MGACAGSDNVGSPRVRKRSRPGLDTPDQRAALEGVKAQMVELEEVRVLPSAQLLNCK